MLFLLLHLGCGGNTDAPAKLESKTCEPWKDRVTAGEARVVFCSDKALTLRLEGKAADAQAAVWSAQLEKRGYSVAQDVSRPRHFAKIFAKETVRLTIAITESHEDTTVSLRWKE